MSPPSPTRCSITSPVRTSLTFMQVVFIAMRERERDSPTTSSSSACPSEPVRSLLVALYQQRCSPLDLMSEQIFHQIVIDFHQHLSHPSIRSQSRLNFFFHIISLASITVCCLSANNVCDVRSACLLAIQQQLSFKDEYVSSSRSGGIGRR